MALISGGAFAAEQTLGAPAHFNAVGRPSAKAASTTHFMVPDNDGGCTEYWFGSQEKDTLGNPATHCSQKIYGFDGDDSIYAGEGSSMIDGGKGADHVFVSDKSNHVTLKYKNASDSWTQSHDVISGFRSTDTVDLHEACKGRCTFLDERCHHGEAMWEWTFCPVPTPSGWQGFLVARVPTKANYMVLWFADDVIVGASNLKF
jgi:hypothetical protein